MAMLLHICVILLSGLAVTYGDGEFFITHTPSHVTFQKEAKKILSSEVNKVVSSTFGFSVNKDLTWDGLGSTSLFARPKANVVVSVEGVPRPLNIKHHRKYEAENDDIAANTASVVNQLQANIPSNPLIVDFSTDMSLFDIREQHPELFDKLPATTRQLVQVFRDASSGISVDDMGALNATEQADLLFLGEIHIIKSILAALKENPNQAQDHVPDFFHLRVQGIQRLVDQYGKSSQKVKDAVNLVEKVIDEVTFELRRLYSDNLIIQVITSETVDKPSVTLTRRARSLLQADDSDKAKQNSIEDQLKVAKVYSDLYPIFFNIFLWGGIAFALVIFAVSYGIWVMDPGKDSIIYRMTSQRIKKD